MGKGNVCTTGKYEGLYFIDNDHLHVYRRDEPNADEVETRLMGDLDYDELTGGDWLFDEWGSMEEEDDVLGCFTESFIRRFPSFGRVPNDYWIKDGPYGSVCRRVILESKLFFIAVEDNEWSVAVELIQKEEPYGFNWMENLQARLYEKYLDGIKKSLLERLPSIGTRNGAWMSGVIKREECIA